MLRSITTMALVVAALGPSRGAAQPKPRNVPYAAACKACRVTLTRMTTLAGTSTDDLTPLIEPVRDSQGRFFAVSRDRFRILMFDSRGAVIKTFGGKGEGPAEMGKLGVFKLSIGPGDSL